MAGVIEPHRVEGGGLGVWKEFVWHPHNPYEHCLAFTCQILMENGQV